eukprot:SAG31_NODE_46156_length_255_cov_1.333333_1_plen_68_part_01
MQRQRGDLQPNGARYEVEGDVEPKCITFKAGNSKHFGIYGEFVTHFLAMPVNVAAKIRSSMYGDRLFC